MYISRLKELTDDQWSKLREALVIHEVATRNVLSLIDSMFGPTPVNQAVLNPRPLSVLPVASPDSPPAEFDMEQAIKDAGKWECGEEHCIGCPMAQNVECISTFQLQAPYLHGPRVRLRLHKALREEAKQLSASVPRPIPTPPLYCPKCGEQLLPERDRLTPPHAEGRCTGVGLPLVRNPPTKEDGKVKDVPTKSFSLPLGSAAKIDGKQARDYRPSDNYETGVYITHGRWGVGKVLSIDASQKGNHRITVEFSQEVGVKVLAAGRTA